MALSLPNPSQNSSQMMGRLGPDKTVHKVSDVVHQNDYELNIGKLLIKKLNAAKRVQHVLYEKKDGGMVITADAATFESVKHAALYYFRNYPTEKGTAMINTNIDNTKKHIVQYTVRVATVDGCSYTANIYTTTSKCMVNGKDIERFMSDDLREIHRLIRTACLEDKQFSLQKISDMLIEQLQRLLDS